MIRAGLGFGVPGFPAGGPPGPLGELLPAPWLGGMAPLLWRAARATMPRHADGRSRAAVALIAPCVVLPAGFVLARSFTAIGPAGARAPRSLAGLAPGATLLFRLAAPPFLVRR